MRVSCFWLRCLPYVFFCFVFFFNDTATTEIYTLSLHDALPISSSRSAVRRTTPRRSPPRPDARDRKSTRLNSSHQLISYAVFSLKKKKEYIETLCDTADDEYFFNLQVGRTIG